MLHGDIHGKHFHVNLSSEIKKLKSSRISVMMATTEDRFLYQFWQPLLNFKVTAA